MQEVPQTELQPLSAEAKAAVALLKYLPLPAALLPRATATLSDGVRASLWPTRAAALVFAQVRHPLSIWAAHFVFEKDDLHLIYRLIPAQLPISGSR